MRSNLENNTRFGKSAIVLLVLAAVLLFPSAAGADDCEWDIEQYSCNIYNTLYGSRMFAQSFQPKSYSYATVKVRLRLGRHGNPTGPFIVHILEDDNGDPTGVVIGSAQIAPGAVDPSGYGDYEFDISDLSETLQQGQTYWIRMSSIGTDDYNWYDVYFEDDNNPYPDGHVERDWWGTGVWEEDANDDYFFAICAEPVPLIETELTADDATATVGIAVDLTATLTEKDSGNPIPGKDIIFNVDLDDDGKPDEMGEVFTNVTDSSGVATLTLTIEDPKDGYLDIVTEFVTDDTYEGSIDGATLTVNKCPAGIMGYSVWIYEEQVFNLLARLTNSLTGGGIKGETVDFYLDKDQDGDFSDETMVSSGVSDSNGVVEAQYTVDVAAGTYTMKVEHAESTGYLQCSDETKILDVREKPPWLKIVMRKGDSFAPLFAGNSYFYGQVEVLDLNEAEGKAQLDITTPWGGNETVWLHEDGNNIKTYVNPGDTLDHYHVVLNNVRPGGSTNYDCGHTLSIGSALELPNGWSLKFCDISMDGSQVVVVFLKDGQETPYNGVFEEGEFIESQIDIGGSGHDVDCYCDSIQVAEIVPGRETDLVKLCVRNGGADVADILIGRVYGEAFWSHTSSGDHPILAATNGETVYMYADVGVANAGETATFKVYEVDRGLESVSPEEYELIDSATVTATVQVDGTVAASWVAEYMEDGWFGAYGDPEFVFIVTVGGESRESGELSVPEEPQGFIDKAVWSSESDGDPAITTAADGDTVYLHVETRGFNTGDEVTFRIQEEDPFPDPDDDVVVLTGQLDANGKCTKQWTVDWRHDEAAYKDPTHAADPPEFTFIATIDDVSRKSPELTVPSGKKDTYIDVDDATAISTEPVDLRCKLYSRGLFDRKDGQNGKTIHWFLDRNRDGDYTDAGENLGVSLTGYGLHLEGTAKLTTNLTGLGSGDYPLRAVFLGDATYNGSTGTAVVTINGEGYAAQITAISQSTFVGGEKTPVIVRVTNIGDKADLKIDVESWPYGWDVRAADPNPGSLRETTADDVPHATEVEFTFYVTAPTYPYYDKEGQIRWELVADRAVVSDIPLDTVLQDVNSLSEIPAPTLLKPEDGVTTNKPVTLDWEHAWETKPEGDPQHVDGYVVSLYTENPDGWDVAQQGDVDTGWAETEAHGGAHSIVACIETASVENWIQWLHEGIVYIEPDTEYTLSVWVKTTPEYSGGAAFTLSFFEDEYARPMTGQDETLSIPAGASDWQQLTLTFTSPTNAHIIGDIRFDFQGGSGCLWFDDLEIVTGSSAAQKLPDTKIGQGPQDVSPTNDVTFTWLGSDPDGHIAGYSYALSGPEGSGYTGTWTEVPATTVSVTYHGLIDGTYVFGVMAKDDEDNYDPTPAVRWFVIGTTADPNLVLNPGFESGGTGPSGWNLSYSGNSDGVWDDEESYTGSRSVRSRLIDDPVEWVCDQDISVDAASYYRMSCWVKMSGTAEGTFMMQLEIEDSGNNPLGTITLPLPVGDRDWTRYTRAFALPAGADHISAIRLRVSDGFGLIWFDDLDIRRIPDDEDIVAPGTDLVGGPEEGQLIMSDEVTFEFGGFDPDGGIQGYVYSLDMAINNEVWFPFTEDTRVSFAGLAAGEHTFYVAAVDDQGFEDPTPAKRVFTVDRPPETTILSGPIGAGAPSSPTFTWFGSDPDEGDAVSGYSYRLKGEFTDTGWSDWVTDQTVSYTNLSGEYTFYVKARDSAGVEDPTPAERSFDVNNSAPSIVASSPASPQTLNEGESLEFSIQAEDADGDLLSYGWLLDGDLQSGGAVWTYTPGYNDHGTHEIAAFVTDGRMSAQVTWDVTVNDVNIAPEITWYRPTNANVHAVVGGTIAFQVGAMDKDGDALGYTWKMDDVSVSVNPGWTYVTHESDRGPHPVQVVVSDGTLSVTQQWTVVVGDCGDVNCNGSVNVGDVINLFNYVGSMGGYPICDAWAADVTGNGTINLGDVILLLNHCYDPEKYPLNCPCD